MAAGKSDDKPNTPSGAREARLAKALRDNLRRRKSPKPSSPPAGEADVREEPC